MNLVDFIGSTGFPIAACCGMTYLFWTFIQDSNHRADRRETSYNQHIDSFSSALSGFNETLVLINKDLTEVKDDVSEIKNVINGHGGKEGNK